MELIQTNVVLNGEAVARDITKMNGVFRPFPGIDVEWTAVQVYSDYDEVNLVEFLINAAIINYGMMGEKISLVEIDGQIYTPTTTEKSNVYGQIMLFLKNEISNHVVKSMNNHSILEFKFDK